jgi:hypothetical protein
MITENEQEKNYNYTFSEFLTIQEIDYSKKDNFSYKSQTMGNTDFYGTENFKNSMDLLKNGQKEKPLEIRDFLKDVNFNSSSNEMILSYEGFQIDYSEYSSGNPECMINFQSIENENKCITVFYNCSYNGHIDRTTILNYGKMILSIISILESKNISIRLVTIDRTKDSNGKIYNIGITIKDFFEVMDIDRITYCLANNSFLRRNMFKMYEYLLDEQYRKEYFSSYGRAINELKIENENDIYINSPSRNDNKDYFINELKTILEKYK